MPALLKNLYAAIVLLAFGRVLKELLYIITLTQLPIGLVQA